MPELRVDGVSLHYEEQGTGDPILCIHGTGSSSALWAEAAAVLGTRGRAIVYDRRGFGRSERPEPFVTSLSRQTDDATALIDALDAAPAIVIGRSTGAEIAIDLALRYPDRVRALALLEPGGLGLSAAYARWEDGLREHLLGAASAGADVGEALIREVFGEGAWEEWPEGLREIFSANGPAIAAEVAGGFLQVTAARLGTITHPTLLVGARDTLPEFADVTEHVARAMPAARVEWVEGGHLIDPAAPTVLAFVEDVTFSRPPEHA